MELPTFSNESLVIAIGSWQLTLSNTSNDDITCLLWPLGFVFLLLPTLFMMLYVFCCGGLSGSHWWEKIAYGPFYVLGAPLFTILTTGRNMFCGCCCIDRTDNKAKASYLKLAEVMCEALPQVGVQYLTLRKQLSVHMSIHSSIMFNNRPLTPNRLSYRNGTDLFGSISTSWFPWCPLRWDQTPEKRQDD